MKRKPTYNPYQSPYGSPYQDPYSNPNYNYPFPNPRNRNMTKPNIDALSIVAIALTVLTAFASIFLPFFKLKTNYIGLAPYWQDPPEPIKMLGSNLNNRNTYFSANDEINQISIIVFVFFITFLITQLLFQIMDKQFFAAISGALLIGLILIYHILLSSVANNEGYTSTSHTHNNSFQILTGSGALISVVCFFIIIAVSVFKIKGGGLFQKK